MTSVPRLFPTRIYWLRRSPPDGRRIWLTLLRCVKLKNTTNTISTDPQHLADADGTKKRGQEDWLKLPEQGDAAKGSEKGIDEDLES
jgi:hypothetical protein